MRTRFGSILCVFGLLAALAGCGGSGSDSPAVTPPPTSGTPPPPPPPPPPPEPVIGVAGGTVTEGSGASVIVPAGAIDTDTTIRIAVDSTGAPPVPASLGGTGSIYMVTPHGGEFAEVVEVRIPAPAVTLQPNQALKIAKAEPGGPWVVLDDTQLADGKLITKVHSFSWFISVVVSYPLPVLQAVPFAATTTLDCGSEPCMDAVGDVTATYTVVGNNGQVRDGCDGVVITDGTSTYTGSGPRGSTQVTETPMPRTGGTITRQLPAAHGLYRFAVALTCNGYLSRVDDSYHTIYWKRGQIYPQMDVERVPEQIDVVEGLQANISVVMAGAISYQPGFPIVPTETDRAVIEWQRSNDSGASWELIGRSYQNEANPIPISPSIPWKYWAVSHGFTATASDQGALIRVHACYTPPAPTAAPPCVTGSNTRINVLQRSALPAITDQPHSVLIRTAETASFSVAVSGLPAPTLQWQSRPANAAGDWTNVSVGTGATTANYTTAPRLLANNGEQYRIVATNALGSVASSLATVSVSDLNVAPSITTQPASLSVTSGNDAIFAVVARGTEALSYQWRFNGANIAGANSAVLRLSAVTSADAGAYTVAVTNSAGNAASNSAVLSVTAGTPAAVVPSIVTQPVSVAVNEGNTATFAVGVDGSGPLSFQWRRDGVNVSGANSASLTFNSVALPNAGSYSVVVTNSAGTITSNSVTLDVAPAVGYSPPTITSEPSTVIVPAGGATTLAVGAAGSGPLSYQWSFNGTPIPGATLPVLSLTNVGNAHVGDYTVLVSNGTDSVNSQVAALFLLGAPAISQDPEATTAYEGQSATFSVSADGSGLRYQWMLNGNPISSATEASYTTPMLVSANSGAVYSVAVYNGAGLVTSAPAVLSVQVNVIPAVLQQPANVTVQPGQSAALCVAFSGTLPLTLHMQRWNGASWASVLDILATSNDTNCFFTPVLALADSGAQFRFAADNPAGQVVTSTVTVTVTAPFTLLTTLASRTSTGGTPNNRSYGPSISADGTLVAFASDGTNLVPGFTHFGHGYVRNLRTGVTVIVDQKPDGTETDIDGYGVGEMKIAAGGRYVVFSSLASGLVPGDTNNSQDVFLRDLETGTTKQLTLFPNGSELVDAGNGNSEMHLDISADGHYVIFSSRYDFTQSQDVQVPVMALFLRDTWRNETRMLVSHPTDGFGYTALASGGDYLAYSMAHFSPDSETVHVMDLEIMRDSTIFTLDRSEPGEYLHQGMSIDRNGRRVAFTLRSPTLLRTLDPQVVVIDPLAPETLTIASTGSVGSGIGMGNGTSNYPKLSDDGRYVLFRTNSPNLRGNLGSPYPVDWAVMVRDLQAETTTNALRRADGTPVLSNVTSYNWHAISGDGSVVAHTTGQADMGDGNMEFQVYVNPRP